MGKGFLSRIPYITDEWRQAVPGNCAINAT